MKQYGISSLGDVYIAATYAAPIAKEHNFSQLAYHAAIEIMTALSSTIRTENPHFTPDDIGSALQRLYGAEEN